MGIDIRLPQINSDTDKGQLAQIKSYLYQLAEQLNWALSNLDGQKEDYAVARASVSTAAKEENDAQNTFDKVKGLIIKSADIVNAYYDTISKKLEGEYEAISDYGTFKENTTATLEETSKALKATFTNEQTVDANGYDINYTMIHSADAWVKIGILEYADGFPVYGMEIGQTNKENGEVVQTAFARYTSNGVSLYDNNGFEVAYIRNYKLYIANVQVTVSFKEGGYVDNIYNGGGVVTKWVGGD